VNQWGVDLGDEASGELNNGGAPILQLPRLDENRGPRSLGLGQRFIEVANLIAGQLAAVGVGQVAVGHEHRKCKEE
jgi:hypothetical protein